MKKFKARLLSTTARPAALALAAAVLLPNAGHAQSRGKTPLSLEASESSSFLPQGTAPANTLAPTYSLAPMPNSDMNAPIPPTPKTAEVTPSLFQPRKQFRGDGYSYGSTSQGWVEQKLKPTPGVSLKVPLE